MTETSPDRSWPISRRSLLAGMAAAGLLPAPAGAAGSARYLSSVGDAAGRHAFAGFDGAGRLAFRQPLPDRGHGVTLHPYRAEALILARRPGTFLRAVDLATGAVIHAATSPPGRHFSGHAVYSMDGARIYATENAYEAATGVIGVYDADNGCARLGEFACHGIDPHELALLPDGRTLAVAIGGILTHPDSGREPLNLATMAPALVHLDAEDGRLLFRTALPPALHQLSIRHLDVAADGTIGLCMQNAGPEQAPVPVAGVQRGDGPIRLLPLPEQVARRTANYGGSVKFDAEGRVLAVACPRGNMALFWDVAEERFLGRAASFDGCGVAALPGPGRFVIASGLGGLSAIDALTAEGPAATALAGADADSFAWDNHLAFAG
ncbi:MAG: DUF1513 domain-containing protein [Alphaproteobacteria bacterium]